MINIIDNFLNKTAMYRLVLYVLVFLFVISLLFSFLGLIPYLPINIFVSAIFILFISWLANIIFAYVYKAPTNVESVYITALILFFIISPPEIGNYWEFFLFAFWVSVWAMASKFLFAFGNKHLFNPAAVAVAITSLAIGESASWWIGDIHMLTFVIIGGILIVRKVRRFNLILAFFITAILTISVVALFKDSNIFTALSRTFLNSAIFFFAFVMLTEPLTTPPTKWLQMAYGSIVGLMFAFPLLFTPEIALLLGNIFSYLVSPKNKYILILKEKKKIANDTFDFIFSSNKKFNFEPGQYMEWTLPHRDPDSRGNRRYFTVASSPTENEIHLGVKFYGEPSSFKNHLSVIPTGAEIVASQQAGDFILPKSQAEALVFIAGGIGVTPFRAMIQYLLDKKESRKITMLYSNRTVDDIAYKDIFDRAETELGIKTIYSVTNTDEKLTSPNMQSGFITADTIKKEIPDYLTRIYYISGPHSMVNTFESTLKSLGVPRKNIKTDFFPGFA